MFQGASGAFWFNFFTAHFLASIPYECLSPILPTSRSEKTARSNPRIQISVICAFEGLGGAIIPILFLFVCVILDPKGGCCPDVEVSNQL